MKKALRIIAFIVSVASLMLLLLKVARKHKNLQKPEQNDNTITYGMREIENPFEDEVLRPENQTGDVLVKIKDYKWYNMYRKDIIAISIMAVIAVMVVVLSVFSFKSREQQKTVLDSEKAKTDSNIIHSLGSIEETVIVVKETLDSVDVHITESEKNVSNVIRELKGKKGAKK